VRRSTSYKSCAPSTVERSKDRTGLIVWFAPREHEQIAKRYVKAKNEVAKVRLGRTENRQNSKWRSKEDSKRDLAQNATGPTNGLI
jgi:hypothetical protein